MTYYQADSTPSKAVATGKGADVKTFATAVLLTFGTGLLMMVGNGLLDSFFGAILGLIAAIFGIVFWKNKLGKVFPAEVPTKGLVLLGVVDVVLVVGLILMVS